MFQTLSALAAGLLLSQAPQTPPIAAEATQPTSGWTTVSTQSRTWTKTGTWNSATGWTWHETVETSSTPGGDSHPFLSRVSDRLSGIFGSHPSTTARGVATQAPADWHDEGDPGLASLESPAVRITTEEPPLLEASAAAPKAQAPLQNEKIKPVAFAPSPTNSAKIRPALLGKLGHAEDYSWIIGQIEIAGGARVVHYAAPSGHDRFGGQMILSGEVDLNPFAGGDLVVVHGGVIPGRAVNLYRVKAISAVKE